MFNCLTISKDTLKGGNLLFWNPFLCAKKKEMSKKKLMCNHECIFLFLNK